ncbi:hypothetical protein HDU98_005925, partial [Podochytrium sp. JEL0797]
MDLLRESVSNSTSSARDSYAITYSQSFYVNIISGLVLESCVQGVIGIVMKLRYRKTEAPNFYKVAWLLLLTNVSAGM